MEIIAEQKYLLMSPRKIRPVAKNIKKLSPIRAIEVLPFMAGKASGVLLKVIKSAMAQAKERGVGDNSLSFKEIQIGEGPRLSRGQPVSRGQWHPIKKRMSHIRVVLMTTEKLENSKTEIKKEGGNPPVPKKAPARRSGTKN